MQWSQGNDGESWQQHEQRPWVHEVQGAHSDPRYHRSLPRPHPTASWESDPRLREGHFVPYEGGPSAAQSHPRPPIAHAYTYPPNMQYPAHPMMSQGPRPSSSGTSREASHSHGYQPYSTSAATHPKKPLLFINAAPTGQDPNNSKPKRKRITPEQLVELCTLFDQTDSPSFDARDKVGRAVGMTNREVQVWFQNRRAKVLREKALNKEPKSNPVKEEKPQAQEAPPLSTFTSRFAATRDEECSDTSAWNHRHTALSNTPDHELHPMPNGMVAAEQSHPPAAMDHMSTQEDQGPRHHELDTAKAAMSARSQGQMEPPPPRTTSHPASPAQPQLPSATSHHRQIFQRVGHPLEMPSPQFLATAPITSSAGPPPAALTAVAAGYRSPTFFGYSPGSNFTSPFFGAPSPSLSSVYSGGIGSSLFSPHAGHASSYSSPSSYFSHPDIGTSGVFSPGFPSPGTGSNFFRLTLDSPGATGYSPRTGSSHYGFDRSPSGQSWDPLNRLPPIVSPIWDPTQQQLDRDRAQATGHRRSQSDHTSDMTRPNGVASTSSDAASRRSLSPNMTRSPAVPGSDSPGTQHPHRLSDQYRRTLSRPSGLSAHSLPSTTEEDDLEPLPAPRPQSAGVGLGMLAMAGEMVEVDDESEKVARERYQATRKLSTQQGVSMDTEELHS